MTRESVAADEDVADDVEILAQEDDIPLSMRRHPLPEGHLWRRNGYGSVETLEYQEEDDVEGWRRVTVTRPKGTWTVGALAEALQVIQLTLNGRATLDELGVIPAGELEDAEGGDE